ncbi:acetyl-CoA carboxylase [Furfurilactobacillus entadae]|uniref:acetyl-CoA carboxylase n=1 Tax=Furfurilactobacillus entadae TaxID=2922307 RepID=UPI0035E5E8BF
MNKDVKKIMEGVNRLFTRVPGCQYHIQVANDKYDKAYNFFMLITHKGRRTRSIPICVVDTYELYYLEDLIKDIRTQTQLVFEFNAFGEAKWPSTMKRIEPRITKEERRPSELPFT